MGIFWKNLSWFENPQISLKTTEAERNTLLPRPKLLSPWEQPSKILLVSTKVTLKVTNQPNSLSGLQLSIIAKEISKSSWSRSQVTGFQTEWELWWLHGEKLSGLACPSPGHTKTSSGQEIMRKITVAKKKKNQHTKPQQNPQVYAGLVHESVKREKR